MEIESKIRDRKRRYKEGRKEVKEVSIYLGRTLRTANHRDKHESGA
jgi:hypothetical protein